MIQEFHLSVTPVGGNEYLVRTERVAPGVPLAEEQVNWFVEDWLGQARQLINNPLMAILQDAPSSSQPPEAWYFSGNLALTPPEPTLDLVALGQQLYNVLFQGTIRDSWMTAQGIAYNRQEILRLRLGLKEKRLSRLPWEVLHANHRPLATGTDVVFSRYQPILTPRSLAFQWQGAKSPKPGTPSSAPILKALVVVAAPTDQDSLDLQREVAHLQAELQYSAEPGGKPPEHTLPEIQLTILSQPDREQLTQALEQGNYCIFHYAGHSNLAATGGNLYLVNRKTGLTEILGGEDLAGLLVNNGIRLAVFNSCRGVDPATAELTEDTREQSLAAALVKRGVPAVLAMAEQIPDDVALTLTRLFYRNLKQSYPIDLSLNRARQGLISAYGSHQVYWALPVLYLHPDFDGYLLESRDRDPSLEEPPKLPETMPLPFLSVEAAGAPELPADLLADSPTEPDSPEELEAFVDQLENQSLELEAGTEEDADLVSDLIRQLSATTETELSPDEEPLLPASNTESLLPNSTEGFYWELPENPLYHQPASDSPAESNKPEFQLHRFDRTLWRITTQHPIQALVVVDWKAALARYLPWVEEVAIDPSLSSGNRPLETFPSPSSLAPMGPSSMAANGGTTVVVPSRPYPARSSAWVGTVLAGVGAAASLFLLGWWLIPQWTAMVQQRPSPAPVQPITPDPTPAPTPSPTPTTTPNPQPVAPSPETPAAAEETSTLAILAIGYFNRGILDQGEQAVTELLDRDALVEAREVLSTVGPVQAQEPEVLFLKGRLAAQFVQTGNADYSWYDAQRYFEAAIERQPDVPLYYTALGFAAYAVDNLERANQVWSRGSSLTKSAGSTPEQDTLRLHANAGLALVFWQLAQAENATDSAALIDKALDLQQNVIATNREQFQPERLRQAWMWPEKAINDWEAFLDL